MSETPKPRIVERWVFWPAAVLVTVFGHYAAAAGALDGASAVAQAHHVFTAGASHAFAASALFLVAAFALVAAGVRGSGQHAPAPAADHVEI